MDRKTKRLQRKQDKAKAKSAEAAKSAETNGSDANKPGQGVTAASDERFTKLLAQNEDQLLEFVAGINKVYQERLGRPAPFVSFVICGMQSSGKSTIMERFLNAPLNIVQEGTGTRCPLDTTCIHDSSLSEPLCELGGSELDPSKAGTRLTTAAVFAAITEHNRKLADKDKFSNEPLTLVYRSSNVQNMRFVDTPGIIANQGVGADNREAIKSILRDTMKRPNSKLCVLLEPKEFSTNAIVDFCDETFDGKGSWVKDAIVLMTKFDKQLDDARSGSKANNFFAEYHENDLYPYLTITPTLDRENIDSNELFLKRKELLENAKAHEDDKFSDWQKMHARYRETDPTDPKLSLDVSSRIGFTVAKDKMREVMLLDTATRLPEVMMKLRKELVGFKEEKQVLEEKKKFRDPNHLRIKVGDTLQDACTRIRDYLDGDLETAARFPELLKDLDDELELEEDSEWYGQTLGTKATIKEEERWREIIQTMFDDETMPAHVNADKKYIGGKQIQRAKELLKAAMAGFSRHYRVKEYVASGAGYLQGGLQRENWERATLSIVKMTSSMTIHPGINFLIKHVATIFRNLFQVAMNDLKQRSADTKHLLEICPSLENRLAEKFDDMLWKLMHNAAEKTHMSLEPWYTTLDPELPNFEPIEDNPEEDGDEQKEVSIVKKIMSVFRSAIDDKKAKELLRERGRQRAEEKRNFLPEGRTSMINDDETDKIILSSFQYVYALQEHINTYLNFQINHYLYIGFKDNIATFPRVVSNEEWKGLVPSDTALDDRLEELEKNITAIKASLSLVQNMQDQF